MREGKSFIIVLTMVVGWGLGATAATAQEAGRIEGTVRSGAGFIADDALVRLIGVGRLVEADAEGAFVFDAVPPGRYLLDVNSERWGRAIEEVVVQAGETTRLIIHVLREVDLEEVVITAGPVALTRSDAVQPTDVMAGQDLIEASAASLGETLGSRPGVSATYFGPGSSRPVIRGLGGNRVRVLQQGVTVADVSDVSPDHGVAIETMTSERIEIVRGPATLLYGSSAIGGVVNVLDGRVPNELPTRSLLGTVIARGSTVANEKSGAVDLRGAAGRVAWHINGLLRDTGDYTIPGFADAHHGEEEEEPGSGEEEIEGILENSSVETQRGSVGVSYIGTQGYLGVSVSAYGTNYGVPGHAEEGHGHGGEESEEEEEGGVRIDMLQQAFDLEGSWRLAHAFLRAFRVRLGVSDYTHDELEGEAVGTTFDNAHWEARLEADHSLTTGNTGVIGLQISARDLALVGEEAYIPTTKTNSVALFMLERFETGKVGIEVGARFERAALSSESASGDRDFNDVSFSGGVNYAPSEQVAFALSASRSVKLPDASELYSNGPHIATRSFEVGNPDLDVERALSLDASMHVHHDRVDGTATLFVNRFTDYIFLRNTTDVEDGLPVFRVAQGDALFRGFEAEADIELYHQDDRHVALRLWGDYTRATLTDGDEALPRIPPLRLGGGLQYVDKGFRAAVTVKRVARQDRVASFEDETDGYTMIDASVGYRLFTRGTVHELMLQGSNLTDTEARQHVSFLKDLAPLPGRDFRLTYRFSF